MKTIGKPDYFFLTLVGVLTIFGLIMLTSASVAVGQESFGDKFFFIKRQLVLGVLPGIVALIFFSKIPFLYLKKLSIVSYLFSIILLLLVFVPGIGSSVGTGARSWIVIAGHSFQPAEFAKLSLVIFLAYFFTKIGKDVQILKQGFLWATLLGFLPLLLVVMQPDTGSAFILFAIFFTMFFVSEAKILHLLGLAGVGVIGLALMIVAAPYRLARLTTFLHPELDPLGKGYQVNQALVALGSGGWLGVGLGHSRQKFQYLPEVHADSIFAIIGEELGFVLTAAFLIVLVLLCLRGLKIANLTEDKFGKFLVSGIVIWFMVQSFLNIGAMVNIFPLTGVPLPFVSHGGTALMIALAAVGIVLNVSKQSNN